MAYSIPFSFIALLRALLQVFVWLTIGGLLVVWGAKNPDKSWAIWLGGVFFFIAYFTPALIAQDLNYRIPELKSVEGGLKKITVKHPYSFFILLINLFFGLSVFGWFVALFWAVSPATVVIPRQLEEYF